MGSDTPHNDNSEMTTVNQLCGFEGEAIVVPMTPKIGLLLAVSCIAAIAGVGSVFELSSGVPQLGTPVTAVILVLSIPVTIGSFWAAVQDARANE